MKKIWVFFVSLFIGNSNCLAQDYYWSGEIWGWDWAYDSTPQGVCDQIIAWYDSHWRPAYSIKRLGFYPLAKDAYNCDFQGALPEPNAWGLIYTEVVSRIIVRKGDGCPASTIYNPTTGECDSNSVPPVSSDKGNNPPPGCGAPPSFVGNPVSIFSGNKFQHAVDIKAPRVGALSLERFYNSQDGLWTTNYSSLLMDDTSSIAVIWPDGKNSIFLPKGADYFDPAGNKIHKENGYTLTQQNNEVWVYDEAGKLSSLTYPTGHRITLAPLAGGVALADEFGNQAQLKLDFRRQPLEWSMGSTTIHYAYNAQSRLFKVSRMQGAVSSELHYHYEDKNDLNLLTGITDERGVRYATWAYDEQGRAISSEHAGGAEKVTLAYNPDGSTTVTNEYGKQATYRFQVIQGVKRIVAIEGEPSPNCPSSNSTFTYDERGLLKTRRDNKGNLTTYDYDARGLEVSRTEAAGTPQARTVTTQWHPTLYRPLQVDEPGRVTRYRYDAQGRETGRTVTEH